MPITSLRKFGARATTRPLNFGSAIVAGAGANTNIAVAGLKKTDALISVVEFPAPEEVAGAVVVDRTAQATVFADGQLRVSVATNTNANRRLEVRWVSI